MESKDIWDRAEQLTKLSAGFALAVYILGFVITGIYYSTLGVAPVNPLRPRIIGAGMLFTVTAAAAYWAGLRAFDDFLKPNPERGQNQVVRMLTDSCLLVLLCMFLAATFWQMTDFGYQKLATGVLRETVPALLFFVGYTVWRVPSVPLALRKQITTVLMLIALLLMAVFSVWTAEARSTDALLGWLLFVSVTLVGGHAIRESDRFSAAMTSASYISQAVLLLTFFAHEVFPHFRPEWGGGSPVSIVLTFKKRWLLGGSSKTSVATRRE